MIAAAAAAVAVVAAIAALQVTTCWNHGNMEKGVHASALNTIRAGHKQLFTQG